MMSMYGIVRIIKMLCKAQLVAIKTRTLKNAVLLITHELPGTSLWLKLP